MLDSDRGELPLGRAETERGFLHRVAFVCFERGREMEACAIAMKCEQPNHLFAKCLLRRILSTVCQPVQLGRGHAPALFVRGRRSQ